MKVAGFVLTGGQSTRMGRDKALLPVGGQTLCERIGDVLSSVAQRVALIGYPERYRNLKYECIADIRPGFGPLSGIETALSHGDSQFHLVASCDVYNMNSEWLQLLLSEVEDGDALCAVAKDSTGNLQPLCAAYRRECLPIVSRALDEGRLRAMDLLKELNAKPVRVNGTVLNLNTPEQYCEMMNADRR